MYDEEPPSTTTAAKVKKVSPGTSTSLRRDVFAGSVGMRAPRRSSVKLILSEAPPSAGQLPVDAGPKAAP